MPCGRIIRLGKGIKESALSVEGDTDSRICHGKVQDDTSALEVLQTAHQEGKTYDIAILDQKMPDMTGTELTRTIRADLRFASLYLIVLQLWLGRRARGHCTKRLRIT
ncbi:hypothetical protein C2W62_23400 [Candidatus Entotheonella serta]|nr:hypothetical protein C2W62_23400 [Candidatus Entotheonella serta]